jgi:hypothetical protein
MSALDQLLQYVSDQDTLDEGMALLSVLPGYDPSYDLLWFSYEGDECSEEYAWMGLLHRDGALFFVNGGYFFEADNKPDAFEPTPVSAEDALADIRWNLQESPNQS